MVLILKCQERYKDMQMFFSKAEFLWHMYNIYTIL